MTTRSEEVRQVSASGRIACILRQFTVSSHPKRLSDLSTGAELPLSTTHRLLQGLVENEVLLRDEYGRYSVGPVVRGIARQLDTADLAS